MKKIALFITLSYSSFALSSCIHKSKFDEWAHNRMNSYKTSVSSLIIDSHTPCTSSESSPLSRRKRLAIKKSGVFQEELDRMNRDTSLVNQASSEKERHIILGNRRN